MHFQAMVTTESPFVSRAVQVTRGSASLRVTIPQVVAEILALRPGDELVWVVDPELPSVQVSKRGRAAVPGAPGLPMSTG
jgi:hypothetical protein